MKGIKIEKDQVKLSLFADDMIMHIGNVKDSMKKPVELISGFTELQDTRSIYDIQLCLFTNNEQ